RAPDTLPQERAPPGHPPPVPRLYATALEGSKNREPVFGRVLDPVRGDMAAFPFAVREGRPALRAGETTLGRGALEALHARIGDTVHLSAHGIPFSARVVGRHV